MNGLFLKLGSAAAGALLFSDPSIAQFHNPQNRTPPPEILPPQKRAEHIEITKAPELESS